MENGSDHNLCENMKLHFMPSEKNEENAVVNIEILYKLYNYFSIHVTAKVKLFLCFHALRSHLVNLVHI